MPYALVIIGLILIVSGVRDTHTQLGAQLKQDLTGSQNFGQYALAIFAVGSLGYIDALRKFSTWFMALILIALVLSNRGFFNEFKKAVDAGPEAPDRPSDVSTPADKLKAAGQGLSIAGSLLSPGTMLGNILGRFAFPRPPSP